jgi:hypothetical protein
MFSKVNIYQECIVYCTMSNITVEIGIGHNYGASEASNISSQLVRLHVSPHSPPLFFVHFACSSVEFLSKFYTYDPESTTDLLSEPNSMVCLWYDLSEVVY